MKFISKRQMALVCAGLGTVGAAGAFSFGGTSALFTSQAADRTQNITAGTVVLNGASNGRDTLTIANMVPGDKHSQAYYQLNYTGSNPAFVGLDVDITSAAANAANGCAPAGDYTGANLATLISDCNGGIGTLPLFDGDSNASLAALDLTTDVTGVDPAHHADKPVLSYNDLAPVTTCTVPAAGPITCSSSIHNIELRSDYTSALAQDYEQWNTGDVLSFRLNVAMSPNAGNAFQGSGAVVKLTGHAVQYANNVATDAAASCATTFASSVIADATPAVACPISWS